jgi:hypothetical protein
LNKPLLMTLWLLILLPLLPASSPSKSLVPNSESGSATASSPLSTAPSWVEVLPLDPATAQIVGEEIDAAIGESWNEGYKAASVTLEPQVTYWKAKAEEPQSDHFWDGFGWGACVVFAITTAICILSLGWVVR